MSTNTANLQNYHSKTPPISAENYQDIINLERPKSSHPMPISSRAAQFSPYAALSGHQDAISKNEHDFSEKINLDRNITIDFENMLQ